MKQFLTTFMFVHLCLGCTEPTQSKPQRMFETKESALISSDEYKYIHLLITQAKQQAIKEAIKQCAKKVVPQGEQGIKGDQGLQGIQGVKGEKGNDGGILCPVGSTTAILEGMPVYCHKLLNGEYTWQECFKSCGKLGMRIASVEGVIITCMSDPSFYDWIPDVNYRHWVVADNSTQFTSLMPLVGSVTPPFCSYVSNKNFFYYDGNGNPPTALLHEVPLPSVGGSDANNNVVSYPCMCGKDLR